MQILYSLAMPVPEPKFGPQAGQFRAAPATSAPHPPKPIQTPELDHFPPELVKRDRSSPKISAVSHEKRKLILCPAPDLLRARRDVAGAAA